MLVVGYHGRFVLFVGGECKEEEEGYEKKKRDGPKPNVSLAFLGRKIFLS